MSRDSEAFYWGLLIVLVAIWGSSFAFIKTAVADMHPAWVAAWRLWTASTVLVIAARVTGEPVGGLRPRLSRDSPAAWYTLVGVFGMAVPFMVFGWSAQTVYAPVQRHVHQQLPHPRGRRHRRPGTGLHVRQHYCLCGGGAEGRPAGR